MRNGASKAVANGIAKIIVLLAWAGISMLLSDSRALAQQQEANQSAGKASGQGAPTQSAVSTGEAHAAVLDNEKRPITAGGFVESGPIVFQDVAEKAGLTRWRHVMGTDESRFILET